MSKGKGIEELAVPVIEVTAEGEKDVSLSMRIARGAKLKKRKLSGGELSFSSPLVQLKHHRGIASAVENSTSSEASENSNNTLSSASSDHAIASCCSRNDSNQLAKQNLKVIDLQEEEASSIEMTTIETYDIESTQRRKTATLRKLQVESAELESPTTTPPPEANRRRPSPGRMLSNDEIEEFFSAAEKEIREHFTEKYNFDFVKEEPLEGRYEWDPVKS